MSASEIKIAGGALGPLPVAIKSSTGLRLPALRLRTQDYPSPLCHFRWWGKAECISIRRILMLRVKER
jgi:hypothetical protein